MRHSAEEVAGSDRLLVTALDREHSDVDTGEIAVDIWIGVLS